MKHKLKVFFLGQFKIILDDKYVMTYDDIGSQKNARLLSYLLKNYHVKLSSQEIQTIMFSDDSSNNPANALKALVYRLRTILKKFFSTVNIIVSGNSTYFINPDLEIILDIDIFDKLITDGENAQSDEERIDLFEEAINLYEGTFLPMLNDEQWVIITGTYLESMFMTTAVYLLKKYTEQKMYDSVEKLSTKALSYDSLNENLHYYLIKSLIKQNKMSLAKQHYLATEKFLFDELGINPSEELQELYQEIISSQRVKEATIFDVQDNLIEGEIKGAFQCSFETFKKIYQLDVRKAIRSGISEYIVLLTIEANDHIKRNSEIIDAIIESTSSLLSQTIYSTLRVGDSFAKYSNQQYLILLPNCNDENARSVVKRILDNFYKADKYERVKINSKIDEIRLSEVSSDGNILRVK
ncbi:MAG: BTAD domain-containing putative transcriptional regulator [Thomasclavelia sp.]|uniref:BTAD domain-containing putative transcriptional regulator n=1 Tax=Thomasclavelia sp. TaxID=3025757 RepID=UPI00399F2245